MVNTIRVAENWKNPPKNPEPWESWGKGKQPWTPTAPWYQRHLRPSTRGLGREAIPFIPETGKFGADPNRNPSETRNSSEQLVKIATNNEFLESAPDYQSTSFDELVSFIALTGSEILQNTRSYDLSTNSESLNKNIMDATTIRESFSPQNIIKLQETSKDYFNKYIYNLANHSFSIDNSTGIATISMPQTSIRKEYKVEIQTLAPKSIENGTIYN